MPANYIAEERNPFGPLFLPMPFGPEAAATVAASVANAAETVETTPAPFELSLIEDSFVFSLAGAGSRDTKSADDSSSSNHTDAPQYSNFGLSEKPAPSDLPIQSNAMSGVTLENNVFSFARPTEGTGGKPPKDTGDTGDTGGLLSSYTSGGNAKTSYNITVTFETGNWTQQIQQLFINAADYLSTIVVGDISDERVPLFGRVDDLTIEASILEIDGPGTVLGGAGVFASRVGSDLPAAAIMQFDVADIYDAVAEGYFYHVVLHEMVHAMGFGGKWADMGLVSTDSGDLRFTGVNATAEYEKYVMANDLADLNAAAGVPIEDDWADGEADGTNFVHWDEATFGVMLMTGLIDISNPGEPTLSTMTIAALEDMGYETIYEPDSSLLFA